MNGIWKLIFAFALALSGLASAMAQTLSGTCSAPVPTTNPTIPQGVASGDTAFFATETIAPEYQPPSNMYNQGFNYLVGMLNAVTVYPCDRGKSAKIEFNAIRVIQRDFAGAESVVQLVTFGRGWQKPNSIVGKTFYREPNWFTSGAPELQPTLAALSQQTYTVDLKTIPKGIYHAWTNPRTPAIPGYAYFVEVVVRVTGDARLQLGMDYWRGSDSDYTGWTPGCTSSNNCQAWLSNWLGDTKGKFVTWRAPSMVF